MPSALTWIRTQPAAGVRATVIVAPVFGSVAANVRVFGGAELAGGATLTVALAGAPPGGLAVGVAPGWIGGTGASAARAPTGGAGGARADDPGHTRRQPWRGCTAP